MVFDPALYDLVLSPSFSSAIRGNVGTENRPLSLTSENLLRSFSDTGALSANSAMNQAQDWALGIW